ncbi:MAG: hypothetical protein WC421_09865 [Elusimicrobiales bacterium]
MGYAVFLLLALAGCSRNSPDAARAQKTAPEQAADMTDKKNAPSFQGDYGFPWQAVEAQLAAGNFKELEQYYAVKNGVKTAKLEIAARKNLKRSLLMDSEITAGDAASAISESGLDAKLLDGSGAKLTSAVDNLLYFDIPLETAAATGVKLSRAGFGARLLALRGPSGYGQ